MMIVEHIFEMKLVYPSQMNTNNYNVYLFAKCTREVATKLGCHPI